MAHPSSRVKPWGYGSAQGLATPVNGYLPDNPGAGRSDPARPRHAPLTPPAPDAPRRTPRAGPRGRSLLAATTSGEQSAAGVLNGTERLSTVPASESLTILS